VQNLEERLVKLERLVLNEPRLHRKEVMQRYSIGKSTLHRWLRAGRLPAPVRLCGPLWRIQDLEQAEQTGRLSPLPKRPVSA